MPTSTTRTWHHYKGGAQADGRGFSRGDDSTRRYETPTISARLDSLSPFRNGQAASGGARNLQVRKDTALVGRVLTPKGEPFSVAVPCEHWAVDGECRFRCDAWESAVAYDAAARADRHGR